MDDKHAAAERFELGEKYYQSGQFREAVEQFQEYIWLNSNDPAGHHSLAMAYCQLGEFALAIDPFLRALRIGPKFAGVYDWLGTAYGELGRHQEALEAYQEAVRLEPENAYHHCGLAFSYLHLKRPAEAIQSARKAVRLKPDSAEAYLNLGCALHFDPETLVAAAAAYDKSLELQPDQFVALANLGDVHLQMGQIEEAKGYLRRAGNINPNDPKLHHLLGQVYLRLGRRHEALREYEILKSLDVTLAGEFAKSLNGPTPE